MTRRELAVLAIPAIVAVWACSVNARSETAAGIRWTAPAGWSAGGPAPMRAATYAIAPVQGDTAAAECVLYFFGAGQGGSVEANIARWRGQFVDAAGKEAAA